MGKGKFHRETMSKKKALRFIFLISFECQAENPCRSRNANTTRMNDMMFTSNVLPESAPYL